jgi:hypothetical protein
MQRDNPEDPQAGATWGPHDDGFTLRAGLQVEQRIRQMGLASGGVVAGCGGCGLRLSGAGVWWLPQAADFLQTAGTTGTAAGTAQHRTARTAHSNTAQINTATSSWE